MWQQDRRLSITAQPRDTRDGACWQGQLKHKQEPGALGWQATIPPSGRFPLDHFPGKRSRWVQSLQGCASAG